MTQSPAGQGAAAPLSGDPGSIDAPRFAYGGQALMEGIYMRGRDAIGVAVRGPDGQIFAGQEKLDSILHRNRFARAPFFRGVVVLYETLVIGTRWLMKSGSLAAAGEGVAFGGKAIALTMLFTIGLAVGLFVLLPLLVAQGGVSFLFGGVDSGWESFLVHVLEGVVRVFIFVGYLALVSRSAEIGRVFQYHGAEHMTIHALESNLPLTVENIRKFPTAHPRCGTEFLVIFIIVSILLFSLLAGTELWVAILGRILLVPVIAAVSYEVLKFGAKRRDQGFWHLLFLPGIWVQRITTKQPDDSMIEVAVCAMQVALAANGETAPSGSLDPASEPIPDVGELAREMEARLEAEEAAAAEAGTPATSGTPGSDEGAVPADPGEAPAPRAGGATESA
ncbi:MAG TPA: DUF1385 domain-containing protein [Anaerolineae bacterium]|nr:DUF1385 domain-containing protein [Anaerolineae bacterium]